MNRIDLFRKRDFGDIFQDSFQYTFQNIRTLLLPLLIWVAPIAVIVGILNAYFSQDLMDIIMANIQSGDFDNILEDMVRNNEGSPAWVLLVIFAGAFVQTALMGGFIFAHMKQYLRSPEKLDQPEILREDAFSLFVPLLLGTLFIYFLLFAGAFVLALLTVLAAQIVSFLGILVGLAGVVGYIYLIVPLFLILIIQAYEGISPLKAVRRTFELIRGNWWLTFGVQFILTLIIAIASAPFSMGLAAAGTMGMPALISSQIILGVITVLFNVPVWVSIGLLYFNMTDQPAPTGYFDEVIEKIGDE